MMPSRPPRFARQFVCVFVRHQTGLYHCVGSVLPLNGILEHMIINVPVSIIWREPPQCAVHTAVNKQRKDEEEKEDEGERKGEREAV